MEFTDKELATLVRDLSSAYVQRCKVVAENHESIYNDQSLRETCALIDKIDNELTARLNK